MKVFVLSKEGKPLMPTTPRRARVWLKAKRARVVRRDPFTIRLRFATQQHTQPAKVGVDTGSKHVGIAAITNGEVVFQADVHLRDDIAEKLKQRHRYRRNRRGRKTRYREARYDNRRRPDGWLPPSLQSKSQATVRAVRFIALFLPVGQITVEVGSFDTQKMQKPDIAGIEYQQGELEGYLLREYLLERFQRTCVYCGAQGVPLEIDHLIPKARGGSNRASNLTLSCRPCNQRKGQQTAAEFGFPGVQAKARVPLKHAAHVSSLKSRVIHDLQAIFGESQVSITYGYETKYKRVQVISAQVPLERRRGDCLRDRRGGQAIGNSPSDPLSRTGPISAFQWSAQRAQVLGPAHFARVQALRIGKDQRRRGLHRGTAGERSVRHQRRHQREESGRGHATQIGTASASHPGLDNYSTAGPGEHQKGERRFLPKLKRGAPAPP